MKLLTPKDIQKAQNNALADTLRREHDAAKALKAIEAKIQKTNKELGEAMMLKTTELNSIDLRIKTKVREEMNVIDVLEKRRNAALEPITVEMNALEEQREHIRKAAEDIAVRQNEVSEAIARLREIDRSNRDITYSFERYREEAETRHAKEAGRLSALSSEIAARLEQVKREEERIEAKVKHLEEIEKNTNRAEEKVKAAMLTLDNTMYQMTKEKKSIDEKRRLLAAGIKELKRKGLWHKQHETKTK